MLDREQYNIERDQALKKQTDELVKYFNEFISHNENPREKVINAVPEEEVIQKIMDLPIPTKGRDAKEVGDELVHLILENSMVLRHPRFFSYVVCSISPYSTAGAILTDIYNPNVCGFSLAIGPNLIEEKLIRWAGSRAGFDTTKCGGLFTSGGSLSNLTGMIAARENKLPGRYDLPNAVAYCSTQGHSSIRKGMRLMGLRDDQIVQIDVDENFRIRLDLLEEAIAKDVKAGRKPFLVVGSCGSTNTGSIDPLNALADIAEKYNMWLHVDGAYGGSILASDIYKNLAKGIERADSFSWDFHKWSMQVYSCSCIVAKDKQTLLTAFSEHPEYLADIMSEEHNDGWDLGIEMSRPARCLKLWYTLQAMGTDQLADVIDYAFFNASIAAKRIMEHENWELISKPSCGALNVRYAPASVDPSKYDELNAAISKEILDSGYAFIVTTVLNQKRCLRLCMINGATETSDVINTIEKMDEIAQRVTKNFQ